MDPVTAKMALQLGVSLAKSKAIRRLIVGVVLGLVFALGTIVVGPQMIAQQAFGNEQQQGQLGAVTSTACLTGTAPASADWTMEQASNAKTIWSVAKSMGMGDRGAVVGIATAMQESNLKVYANSNVPASLDYPHQAVGHDHDSVNLFQQRQSWGPLKVLMDPVGSSRLFFAALKRISGWQQLPVTVAAQRVQISAYPDAYAKWEQPATSMVAKLDGTAVETAGCEQDIASTGGGPVPASFDHQGNPRTVEQAVAWITSKPNGAAGEPVRGACERYMNLSFGLAGGYPTALAHWNAPGPRSTTGIPPRGSLVFIRSANPAGHVIESLGQGQAVSTDYWQGHYAAGKIGVGSITQIASAMGGPVLGWRAPNFQVGSGR